MRIPSVSAIFDAGIFEPSLIYEHVEELYSYLGENEIPVDGEIYIQIAYVPKEVAQAKRTIQSAGNN